MPFIKLSLVFWLAHGATAYANEHGGGGGGEAGAEGGEGAAVKPPRDQKEFTEKTNKMNALAGKIEEAEKRFKELVHEKEESHDAAAKAPLLKEMVEIAKQREKDEKEFSKLKTELQQRYPNQGARVNRHVGHAEHGEASAHGGHGDHEEKRTATENSAPSLDDLIKETKALMDRKYRDPAPHGVMSEREPASVREPVRPKLRLER